MRFGKRLSKRIDLAHENTWRQFLASFKCTDAICRHRFHVSVVSVVNPERKSKISYRFVYIRQLHITLYQNPLMRSEEL